MTYEIFDQQLALSLQRLEALWRQVDELPKPSSAQLWQDADEVPEKPQEELMQSLEELSLSLQELQVAAEELRQQNEALAESRKAVDQERQHYQELFEFAPDGYVVTDKESAILEVNQTAAQLLNVSSERLVGKPLVVFVAPEERRDFYSQLRQFQKGEPIKNWQVQLQRWRGASFRVSFTVAPIKNPQGEVVGLRWQLQDLTSPKKESPQKQSDRLFRAMFENSAVGIALLDSQGRLLKSNRVLQETLGYSEQELQTSFSKLLNLDEPGMESAMFQQLLAGRRRSYQLEKRLSNPDRSMQWGRLTFSLVRGTQSEPPLATCILEDITALRQLKAEQQHAIEYQEAIKQQQATKKLELSLQEQKNSFNQLLETPNPQIAPLLEQLGKILNDILSSTSEFFFVCDRAGKYIYVNRAAAQALGFNQSDFISKTWQQLELPAEVMERLDAQRAIVFTTGVAIADEASFPTKDGIRDYEYTMTPITDTNHKPEAVVVTVRDITEQKLAAVAISEALAKEEEFSTLQSHFSYFVSVVVRELRNPLNNIFACTKLIESNAQPEADEKLLYYLQLIQANVRRINQLLHNLLLIKKLETKELSLNPALLNLTEFCRELTEDVQQGAGFLHQLSFISECHGADVCMDKKLLRHLLTNLLLNAIKSSPEGSEVKMELICQEEQVVFHIQDSGSGLSPEDQELLFKTFHRGSPLGTVAASSLGLLVVKQCVELQGGEIFVASDGSVGTTFTVTLPLHQQCVDSNR
ncbi:PAS domain S-box protein [Allocoleopsis sp.]|uniref:sensor histidine kinase n=1 Tax=Allocoleopsis sp. TaxID=3088169 RepID=UPI002FD3C0D8